MKQMRILFLSIIILVICVSLSGCDRKQGTPTEKFKCMLIADFSQIKEQQKFDAYDIIGIAGREENTYVLMEGYNGTDKIRILYRVLENVLEERIHFDILGDSEIVDFDIGTDGNVYLLEKRYNERDNTQDIYLQTLTINGEREEVRLDLTKEDVITALQIGQSNEFYLFLESGKICVFDKFGKTEYEITTHEGETILDTAWSLDNHVIFVSVAYSGDKESLNVYSILYNEKRTEHITKLNPEDYNDAILINGAGTYLFYLRGNQYVSGYSIEKNREVPLMRWAENGVICSEIEKIYALSDEKWIALEEAETTNLIYMQKEEPKEKVDKQKLQMLCLEVDFSLQKQVADFNKNNSDYYIEVLSYEDRENPYQAFLMDLTTGKEADIIVLPLINEEVFLKKNLFVDLYPFMETEQEIHKQDFLPNVLKAYERDGKLYQTVSKVNISGWMTKKSNLKGVDSWNWNTFEKVLEEHPEAALFPDASSEEILKEIMTGMLDSFVDWEQGTCDFTLSEFNNILEIAGNYGKKQSKIELKNEIQELMKEDLLFSKIAVTPFDIELYAEALQDDFVFLGPSFQNGTGGVFWSSDIQCGIAKNSKYKDGAWQFVRTYFTKQYQDLNQEVIMFGAVTDGMPVRKDCFEEFVLRYTATEGYEKDGVWIEPIQGNAETSRFDYTVTPMSREQENAFREIVTGTVQKEKTDEQIISIILEESKAYFGGEKSQAQVTEIIQKRVSTYLNEMH